MAFFTANQRGLKHEPTKGRGDSCAPFVQRCGASVRFSFRNREYPQWAGDERCLFNHGKHKGHFRGYARNATTGNEEIMADSEKGKYKNTSLSESENKASENSYEEFLEDTRKKQEEFIKERGASFVFYESFIEALEDMSDKEFRACILALTNYGLHKKSEEYKGIVKMYMTQAKPQLDANERKKIKARTNGMQGGAPLGNQNARKTT
jgi:hypothetical protein